MQKIVGVTEFQRGFRSVFDGVVRKRVPCILTRGSRPEAVLIAYEDFARFQELEEKAVLARFDRLVVRMAERNASFSEEEIAVDVQAVSGGRAQ